jgi:hypothetical protein
VIGQRDNFEILQMRLNCWNETPMMTFLNKAQKNRIPPLSIRGLDSNALLDDPKWKRGKKNDLV